MKELFIIVASILVVASSIPTEFDLRVQSSLLKFADYNLYPEGICAGYAAVKELAQVVSNAVSLQAEEKMSLSAQQILECSRFNDDRCYKTTKDNILQAMKEISKNGITTSTCYNNKPLQYPADICKTKCTNGNPFNFVFKVDFIRHTSVMDVFDLFKKSQKAAVFALIKVDDSLNFYNSFNPILSSQSSQVFQYRIAEVLGWKNQQKTVILRLGAGEQWGFNGYIDLQLQTHGAKYIQEYYSVNMKDQVHLRMEQQ